jgi:hypothetical protein
VDQPLEEARRALDGWQDDEVDGLINFWDFPVDLLTAKLAAERGLPGPNVAGLLKCKHKYWSRLIQRETAPEVVPDFAAVDPHDDRAWDRLSLDPPFWLKPVTGFLGQLGFLVRDRRDFEHALSVIRPRIRHFGEPLNQVLDWVDLPDDIAELGGHACIAEGLIGGRQCTLEGFQHDGDVEVYGVVDSTTYPWIPVFFSLEYPSQLPGDVEARMVRFSKDIIRAHGLEEGSFNIEYYWDARRDEIKLLEINPRISQSHGPLFQLVDGAPNHVVPVDLARGRRPGQRDRRGVYGHAGKFMVRRFDDARVRRVPREDELAALQERFPRMFFEPMVEVDERLSEVHHQDQYSYLLAELFIGGDDPADCHARYYRCQDAMTFELDYQDGDDWTATGGGRRPT